MPDESPERPDPMRTCAYSGRNYPESEMVRMGDRWVALEHQNAAAKSLSGGGEPEIAGGAASAPPLQFVAVVARSWDLYRRHALLFCALFFTVNTPCNFLQEFVGSRLDAQKDVFKLLIFSVVVTGVIASVGTASIYHALARIWTGRRVSYGIAWVATLAGLIPVLLASLSYAVLVSAGMILCLIPGILVAVRLAFYLCFVVDAKRAAWPSVEASASLTRGRFWLVLGCTLAVSIPLSSPAMFYAMLAQAVPALKFHWIITDAVVSVLSLPMSFFPVFNFVLYKALLAAPPVPSPSSN